MLHAGGPIPARLPSLPGKKMSRDVGKCMVALARRRKAWYHVLFGQQGAITVAGVCDWSSLAVNAGRAVQGGLQ
jgi:hypothetical protein